MTTGAGFDEAEEDVSIMDAPEVDLRTEQILRSGDAAKRCTLPRP